MSADRFLDESVYQAGLAELKREHRKTLKLLDSLGGNEDITFKIKKNITKIMKMQHNFEVKSWRKR
jgi:hypothetical protein